MEPVQREIEWRAVPGYGGRYLVSSLGEIRKAHLYSGKPGRIQGRPRRQDKYVSTTLSHGGKYSQLLVHRIVALAFIPNPENKPEVNHKNGIKNDNRVENLEWATSSENQRHAVALGLHRTGERCSSAKLTNKKSVEILERWRAGAMQATLAAEYGVSIKTVSQICCGHRWSQATGQIPRMGRQLERGAA